MTLLVGFAMLTSSQGQDQTVQTIGVVDAKHQKDLDRDIERGKKYSEIVDKDEKLSEDQAMIDRVQRIGGEFGKIANENAVVVTWGDKRINPFNYTFKVIKGDDVNAFSLPGGYIYVYEGLLKFVESDDELAGVMSHEVAHASLRHIATLEREQSKLSLLTIPMILAGIIAGGETGTGVAQLGSLWNTAKQSGWSVSAEQAADYAGFQYMLKSKYNPVGILTFMERLGRRDMVANAIDWGIYQTHPPTRERAEALQAKLAQYGVPTRRSLVSSSYAASLAEKDGITELKFQNHRVAVFAGPNGSERAKTALSAVNLFLDRVPAMFDVAQDGAKVLGRREALFEVREEDAQAMKAVSAEDGAKKSAENLRRAVYQVSMRVWRP